jgi:hypothetical protein
VVLKLPWLHNEPCPSACFPNLPLPCATSVAASPSLSHAHTAHPLVVAVPVQFNVLQVGCMHNDISILLYQLRISGQLFLKNRRKRKNRVGKRSQG